MNRSLLAKVISDKHHSIMEMVEPDITELVQTWWDSALTLWDTKTPDELFNALLKGPWTSQEMMLFDSQLDDIQVIIKEAT